MPAEALLDSRFAALPRLIRDATNPHHTPADVGRFIEDLLRADPALFACVLEFTSREGHSFVLVRHTGGSVAHARAWSRWPLRRLFSSRRACVITNPLTGERGLAVPFSLTSGRHVVIAPLAVDECDSSQHAFLDAIQSMTLPLAVPATLNDYAPRFVWLGPTQQLSARVAALVNDRGWTLTFAPTFGHVLMMLESDRVDVALVEAVALTSEVSSLRALRHAAKIGDAPIVYFSDNGCDSEIGALVDSCLATTAGEAELLRTLKDSVALVSRTRSQALRSTVERLEQQLRGCSDHAELAQRCAEGALMLGADAVSVMLADESGGVHAAHLPAYEMLGDHWPTPFMTGETITSSYAGDEFFEAAFDDLEYATRVRELHPVAAAALPISSGNRIVGTMLAFSTEQPMFAPEFDALTEFCKRTGRLSTALRVPRVASGPWQRTTVGAAMVEVFSGERAGASVCMRSEGGVAAIVMVESNDERRVGTIADHLLREPECDLREIARDSKKGADGILLAIVQDDRLRFACDGLPLPLRVPLSGPVAAARCAQTCETGTIALDAQSLTLLYSTEFASQVQTAHLVAAVQRGLRSSRATLARSLPRLGKHARKLAFACITMLSNDAELPRPAAFV